MREVNDKKSDWPHAPPHRLSNAGVYFVTSRTVNRKPYFQAPDRRSYVRDRLLELSKHYGLTLEAWAVLSNHYHFVGHSPESETTADTLRILIRHLHADVARFINHLDGAPGRKVWHNYRETRLTFQNSYIARLRYTHENAVHHGIVFVATEYPWCSARLFESSCSPAWIKTVKSFAYNDIAKSDDDIDLFPAK